MKKIVFVIETLDGGGAERVTVALANELCARGKIEVHIINYSCDPQREYPTDSRIHRHEVSCMGGSKVGRIWGRIRLIRQTVKSIAPDCVVSLGSPLIVAPLTAAMVGLGIPLILSERNDPRRFPEKKFRRMLRMVYYTFCDALVFQTGQARDFFPVFMRKKSTVICNPITGQLPPRHEGQREKRIVNFCRLVPQKNLDLLIDAFSDIANEFPDYTLEIYGDGPLRQRLEKKIQDMNLQDRILLQGQSNQIYEDIRKAALFVSSSDYEGISNSMLEAMALGVPTVCTDCPAGGARETILHGENGLLVPTGDRAAMAEAMATVLRDPALAEKMSVAGTELRAKISVSAIADKWLAVIDQICDA
jgi:glycosyltransferase involved in cell wall biosynthesis